MANKITMNKKTTAN